MIKLDQKLILASKSPRRKKLLEQLGFKFEIIVTDTDEIIDLNLLPEEICQNLAEQKAQVIARKITFPAYVIGADTIVVIDGEILGKPADKKQAFDMLMKLSDNTHAVFTGISIFDTSLNRNISFFAKTDVTFRALDESEIIEYIESGSPMDKAGAYGIQNDFGAVFVKKINGCYYNVVGFPLEMFYSKFKFFLGK